MKKKYRISGLNCANCARTLQTHISKIDGIKSVQIDFLRESLEIESDNPDKTIKKVVELTRKLEPEAEITGMESVKPKQKHTILIDVLILCFGTALGILSMTLHMPSWLFWMLFSLSALIIGYKTYYKAFRLLLKGIINENFLITISVIGATAIGEHMDGLMVIVLYTIGKILENLALTKSKNSIEELTNLRPEYATIVKGKQEIKVLPEEVKINDIIIIRPGEKVPLDGIVIDGSASLNMQSLTGESLPVNIEKQEEIMSGSIVLDGVLKIKVTSDYKDGTINRIMQMIEKASEKKSKTETVISKISRWYTLAVVILAIVVSGIVFAITSSIHTSLYRGMIFLVTSCPCAFAISVPLSYFSGIGNASKNGILIKGSNYLDLCAKINTIALDKTGTITSGEFDVVKTISYESKYSENDIIYIASLGEQYSNHPLAKSIVRKNNKNLVEVSNVKEIAGQGVYYSYDSNKYFVGRKTKENKNTAVEVYENDKKIGEIFLQDSVKETSKTVCQTLNEMGISTTILSGDNAEAVNAIAKEIGAENVLSNLLPEDKYKWIEKAKAVKNNVVGYVGDGINDAPSLMLADVGISMGINGSPASIEASDIVLATDNLSKIPTAIEISKFTRKIVWQNIIFAGLIKIIFLSLGAFGITGMLPAVIADVGVTLLAILNSLRVLNYKPKGINKSRIVQ